MNLRVLLFCVLAVTHVEALAQNHALSAKAGMLGLGLEYTYSLSERWAVRGGPYGSTFSQDQTEAGIDYEVEVEWDSLSLALDFHPTSGSFRLSAGVLQNDNGALAESNVTQPVDIGGMTYTPAEIGTLRGVIDFSDDIAPFVSLGWDWSRSKRFGIALDLGLLNQGAPRVTLTADGTLTGDPLFEADLAREEAELEDALSDLDIFPFITLGLIFRF
jgi:hypothetical protein